MLGRRERKQREKVHNPRGRERDQLRGIYRPQRDY